MFYVIIVSLLPFNQVKPEIFTCFRKGKCVQNADLIDMSLTHEGAALEKCIGGPQFTYIPTYGDSHLWCT